MHAFALISVGSRGTSPRRPNRPGPLMSTLPFPPLLPLLLVFLSFSFHIPLASLASTSALPLFHLVHFRTDYRQPTGPLTRVSLSPNPTHPLLNTFSTSCRYSITIL